MNRGEPLALAMIDIDHFKRFNDDHGHAAGDRVLSAVANQLVDRLRPSDLLARIGGEEFVAIFVNTSVDGSTIATERLLASVCLPACRGRSRSRPARGDDFDRGRNGHTRASPRRRSSRRLTPRSIAPRHRAAIAFVADPRRVVLVGASLPSPFGAPTVSLRPLRPLGPSERVPPQPLHAFLHASSGD
ncbi:MAG: GGDEF domain-containing protein [Myxococcota bacterium]|nr:GGDEF domain-containing protein [Myxococcota bacterium]